MNLKDSTRIQRLLPALGAALTVLCGLLLWKAPFGEAWVNASYDYLFRFDSHAVSNRVALIVMDNDAYDYFHQTRSEPWDRALHAQLLQKLTADGCAMVVFDTFFRHPQSPIADEALAEAMRRHGNVVLMAEQAEVLHPEVEGVHPTVPCEPFLSASKTNWGIAWLDPDLDSVVRRHWPFPAPGPSPSLAWTAALLSGTPLTEKPREQWLRYYGRNGGWSRFGYRVALIQPTDFFRDQIVFVGTQPKTSVPDGEPDEFRTPYTRWTGESTGGVDIMLTSFLNLVNGDGLERLPWWIEGMIIVLAGIVSGGMICRFRPLTACAVAVASGVIIALGAVLWSHYSRFWFPWLVLAGGEIPCALVWAIGMQRLRRAQDSTANKIAQYTPVIRVPDTPAEDAPLEPMPEIPDYELVRAPFGQGAYGKVWLARNAVGQWQALKVIYLAKFNNDPIPFEREFNGIRRYKPVSDKHPGLLRIDFVSKKRPDFFYYVMELGDSLDAGWEKEPSIYKPCDLANASLRVKGKRLPILECLRIGIGLSEALEFLHQQGLTHRDIKPRNIIFVNGQPKLADVGLVGQIGPIGDQTTYVGTPAYLPPPPEHAGTPQADIFALGMVLYVLSSGHDPMSFPDIATTLAESGELAAFLPFNEVLRKACHPDRTKRYSSAAELRQQLEQVRLTLQK